MGAAKVGNAIYITGTGNTPATVYSDIADTTWFDRTDNGDGTYTYSHKGSGSTTREFRIRRGGELTIGDPDDYSFHEILEFAPTYNDRNRFYIDHGGSLKVYGNVQITGSTNSYYTYFRWYGKNYWRGNATYRPKLTKIRRVYWYWNSRTTDDYTHDIWDWDKVDVHEAWGVTTNSYTFYFNDIRHTPEHTFKDVDFDGKTTATSGQYLGYTAIYATNPNVYEMSKILFDGCTIQHYYYGTLLYYDYPTFKNCTFKETYSYGIYFSQQGYYKSYDHHYSYEDGGDYGQRMGWVENCTFTDCYWSSSNHRDAYNTNASSVIYKDCTFSGNYINIYSGGNGRALIWSGNTFAASTNKQYSDTRSSNFWVYALDLTINDEDGNPMEDALVYVTQSGDKENWTFRTDSSGKVKTIDNLDNKILLVNKEQYSASSTTMWSDSSNSTYHTVIVYKEDYRPYTEDYVMDQDRSDTIQMVKIDAHSGVF